MHVFLQAQWILYNKSKQPREYKTHFSPRKLFSVLASTSKDADK